MQKSESRLLLPTILKFNSKWVKNLNGRPENISYIKEKIGKTLHDLHRRNISWIKSMQARKMKEKLNIQDYMKLKCFHTAEETITKTMRHPTEWKKKFSTPLNWQESDIKDSQRTSTTWQK